MSDSAASPPESGYAAFHPTRSFHIRPWLCQNPDGGSFPLHDRRTAWDGSLSVPSAIRRPLFPPCLEDWIAEDNPVRVVDAFVEAWTSARSALRASMRHARVDRATIRPPC